MAGLLLRHVYKVYPGTEVVMGWLNMWDRNIPSEKYGFTGMLTVPRKVFVKNDRICQTPIVKTIGGIEKQVEDKLIDNVVLILKKMWNKLFHKRPRPKFWSRSFVIIKGKLLR